MTRLHFQSRHRFPAGFTLDAEFEAADGITALFGHSGSGKSTTLGIIAGTLRPDRGSVTLDGQVLLDTQKAIALPPEKRNVGYVFQDQRLFPHLSVEENLRYGLKRKPFRQVDFSRVVEILEIGELLGRNPRTLSGGQQQRVALGRAVLRGPKLLLMDEPLNAFDASLKNRIVTYLESVVKEWQIPTLFVSHDQLDVRRFAAHVVVLNEGKVVAVGPTGVTFDQAVIGGKLPFTAPLNLVRVEAIRDAAGNVAYQLGSQRLHLPSHADASQASAYVRFHASDVALSRGPIAGISIRNQLRGTVREVLWNDGKAFVAVDLGQTIWAEITADAFAELQLAIGCDVICLIKTTALQVSN